MRKSAIVLLALVACSSAAPTELVLREGDVVTVVSTVKGDELVVTKGAGEARVRLLGVHAFSAVLDEPQVEALAAGGQAALSQLVKGKEATLRFDRTAKDSAGRFLAYAEVDGVDVGAKLVEDGWAVAYTEFPFAREQAYLTAEVAARQAQKNLWGLRPAAELVRGLRRQWAKARPTNGGGVLHDPLAPSPDSENPPK